MHRFDALRRTGSAIALAAAFLVGGGQVAATEILQRPNTNSPIQGGTDHVSYWSPEQIFLNVFKQSNDWVFQTDGGDWGSGSADGYTFDDQDYPIVIPEGQYVESLMNSGGQKTGEFVVLYDGTGVVEPNLSANAISTAPGRQVWDVSGKFTLRIRSTDPNDHVRNIRIVPSAYEAQLADMIFDPAAVEDLRHYRVLRFMDWNHTNGSTETHWSERTLPDHRTMHGHAVAYEYMAALCNETMADAWITVPAYATDDYVRSLAELLRDQLDPRLRMVIEYSNETWNAGGSFRVAWQYCQDGAATMGPNGDGVIDPDNDPNTTFNGHHFHSYRSMQMWDIFEEVLGGDSRLIRVVPGQSGNPWTFGQRLDDVIPGDIRAEADCVAGTNYWAGFKAADVRDGRIDGTSVQGWLDWISGGLADPKWGDQFSGSGSGQGIIDHAQGIPLISYEGGLGTEMNNKKQSDIDQSGYGGTHSEWVDNMIAAAGHEDLEQLTYDWSDAWFALDDTVLMMSQFTTAGSWSKFGTWGLYNDYQPLDNANRLDGRPRMRGMLRWLEDRRVANQMPQIAISAPGAATVGTPLNIDATVSDDGARQLARVHYAWMIEDGPSGATVAFADRHSVQTTATFDQPGTYALRLYGNDGWGISYDSITITVTEGQADVTPPEAPTGLTAASQP